MPTQNYTNKKDGINTGVYGVYGDQKPASEGLKALVGGYVSGGEYSICILVISNLECLETVGFPIQNDEQLGFFGGPNFKKSLEKDAAICESCRICPGNTQWFSISLCTASGCIGLSENGVPQK